MSAGEVLGYDPSLLRRLRSADRDAIDWLAAGWLLSAALLACPISYVALLVTHSALVSAAVGCFCLGLVIAVLRLTVAGGGAAPHQALRAYDASIGSLVLIGLLSLMFAQPAQLILLRAEVEAPLAQRREALLAQHTASAQRAGFAPGGAYARELARCEFVALRLQRVWQRPARALRYTLCYCLLVIFPGLSARTLARAPLRRYERERAWTQRKLIQRDAAAAQAQLQRLLSVYPSHDPSLAAPFDPFQLRQRDPLRDPWRPPPPPAAESAPLRTPDDPRSARDGSRPVGARRRERPPG